jgi:hypothetical protein
VSLGISHWLLYLKPCMPLTGTHTSVRPLQAVSQGDGYRCFLPYSQLVRWALAAPEPRQVVRPLSCQEVLQRGQHVPPAFVEEED